MISYMRQATNDNVQVCADLSGPEAQYAWPPHDPTRLPDVIRDPSASPFVYGDGFNPALRPTSSLRSREKRSERRQTGEKADLEAEGYTGAYSSGSERENGSSVRSSSSPEPYLSDYDEEGWGPEERGRYSHEVDRMRPRARVREGSEGLEVRAVGGWGDVGDMDNGDDDDLEGRAGRPWEDRGRYNVYVPHEEWAGEGGGWSDDER